MVRAIIFDLDGTLVDTEALHHRAFKEALAERGLVFVPEEYGRAFGQPGEEFCKAVLGPGATRAQARALLERKTDIYQRLIRDGVPPTDGAEEFLNKAEGLFRLGIATSTKRENLETILDMLGWRAYFKALVSEEDTERGKPDPSCLLLTAERLGVKPQDCCVIEDASYGIEAAKLAGMTSVGVTGCGLYHRDLSGASIVVKKLSDLDLRRLREM